MKRSAWLLAVMVVAGSVVALAQPEITPIKDVTTVPKGYGFGPRLHPLLKIRKMHEGVDFKVPTGTPVRATASGVVIEADSKKGFGVTVRIRHQHGYVTCYAHLDHSVVKKGMKVTEGSVIAYSGNSGLSAGPHLHYEVIKNGKHVDPKDYFASN